VTPDRLVTGSARPPLTETVRRDRAMRRIDEFLLFAELASNSPCLEMPSPALVSRVDYPKSKGGFHRSRCQKKTPAHHGPANGERQYGRRSGGRS